MSSMKKRAFLALIVAGALSSTACSDLKSTPAQGSEEKVKYQVVASGDTESRLDVVNVIAARVGDTAKASVEVRNDSNFSYKFEYRFKWYDASGMEINPDSTAWTPVAIMANETKSLQSLAPNPSGATFKLFLQEKP
ncbi:MAG: YcfL family protein [Pseudomonadota bacterium]